MKKKRESEGNRYRNLSAFITTYYMLRQASVTTGAFYVEWFFAPKVIVDYHDQQIVSRQIAKT